MADDPSKLRAEVRARQAEDGRKAMAEYEANAAATRAKTEKLRALRLARDAAGVPAAAAKAKPKAGKAGGKAAAAKKGKAAPKGSLADWLDDQSASGRNT